MSWLIMRAVSLDQALPEGRWPKTSDLIVTGTVPDGWRTRPRST